MRTDPDGDEFSTTTPPLSQSSSLRTTGYREAVALFQCSPGKREKETIKAYEELIGKGYAPEAIVSGVKRYMAAIPRSEQKRFPIKFFENADLVRGWCGRPEKQVDEKLLRHITHGWIYPFADGMDYVHCDRNASRDEAAAEAGKMVARGEKKL